MPRACGYIIRINTFNTIWSCRWIAGFGALLQAPNSARVNTVRFPDGDFVFTHTNYNFWTKNWFDIFRIEDGKIVEHWDNLQETKPIKWTHNG